MVKSRLRLALAAALGNALEYYDFATYAFFAIQIGRTFFPSADPFVSLLASLATFGAGFASRPLGAWVLGRYGDRVGRGPAMIASMAIMGVAILMMVLCPGYAQIGIAAPIIVVIARLLQGFAFGGEIGASTTYMMEIAPPQKRGFYVSFHRASQLAAGFAGSMVGLVLSLTLPAELFESIGWRIALGFGVVIVPYAMIMRRALPEPEHFEDPAHVQPLGQSPEKPQVESPEVLPMGIKRTMIGGMIMISGAGMGAYVMPYMATYGQATLHLSVAVSMTGQALNCLAGLAFCLLGGILSDRWGRKPVVIGGNVLTIIFGTGSFALMLAYPSAGSFILATTVLAVFFNLAPGPMNASTIECIPRSGRSFGFAMAYAIPAILTGATTQFMIAWLTRLTGSPMAVIYWAAAGCTLTATMMFFMRESAPVRMRTLTRTQQTIAAATL